MLKMKILLNDKIAKFVCRLLEVMYIIYVALFSSWLVTRLVPISKNNFIDLTPPYIRLVDELHTRHVQYIGIQGDS